MINIASNINISILLTCDINISILYACGTNIIKKEAYEITEIDESDPKSGR